AGTTWREHSQGLPPYPEVRSIMIDPFSGSSLYVGLAAAGSFYKSVDGGQSWSQSYSGLPTRYSSAIYSLAADPANACVLYAGTFTDTIYKSADCGASWAASNTGIDALEVYGVAIDPSNPANIYVGTHGSGVYRSTNGGLDWSN